MDKPIEIPTAIDNAKTFPIFYAAACCLVNLLVKYVYGRLGKNDYQSQHKTQNNQNRFVKRRYLLSQFKSYGHKSHRYGY